MGKKKSNILGRRMSNNLPPLQGGLHTGCSFQKNKLQGNVIAKKSDRHYLSEVTQLNVSSGDWTHVDVGALDIL